MTGLGDRRRLFEWSTYTDDLFVRMFCAVVFACTITRTFVASIRTNNRLSINRLLGWAERHGRGGDKRFMPGSAIVFVCNAPPIGHNSAIREENEWSQVGLGGLAYFFLQTSVRDYILGI